MSTLPEITDLTAFHSTRDAWHALAEHVLSAARQRATGRIGLRAVPGGFGTPLFGDDEELRVDGADLVITRAGRTERHPITTIGAAADAVGIVPGMPDTVYAPTTPLAPAAVLTIDRGAAGALAEWFALGTALLETLRSSAGAEDAPSDVVLWPEHFDVGLELGRATTNERATFGTSAGDALHPLPYLYVTQWPGVRDDAFWNDAGFPGASLGYEALADAPDAVERGRAFYASARSVLTRRSS